MDNWLDSFECRAIWIALATGQIQQAKEHVDYGSLAFDLLRDELGFRDALTLAMDHYTTASESAATASASVAAATAKG